MEVDNLDEEDSAPLDLPLLPHGRYYKVIAVPSDPTIHDLSRRHQRGKLNIQPEYQREFVWSPKKASRLIESILMGVPIPLVYLADNDDGTQEVIDGQQRLTSLFNFLNKELVLIGMEVLKDLEKKQFKDIPQNLQDVFENYAVHVITIKKESDPNVRFAIFERLNAGATPLRDQEIRNCIFRGPYNDLLKSLAENSVFSRLVDNRTSEHMGKEQLILRFFAFWNATHLKYKSPMKQFLNKEMESGKELKNRSFDEMTKVFKKSLDLCYSVWGERAFRRYTQSNDQENSGAWEDRFNWALFDVQMAGFSNYEKHQIQPRLDQIFDESLDLMLGNPEFNETFHGPERTENVQNRFEKWNAIIKKAVGAPETESRGFSKSFRQELFNKNPQCQICLQQIRTLEDAQVDHIELYSKGGKTEPENARLVHRFCNLHRPKK